MAKNSQNWPAQKVNNLTPSENQEVAICLYDMPKGEKPRNINELRARLANYFDFCRETGFRCGIETLCLSLGITRQTLLNWCRGEGCSQEWQDQCLLAKQYIYSFLEQASLTGKINPVLAVWYGKNWCGYKDAISLEENTPVVVHRSKTLEDIQRERIEREQNYLLESANTADTAPEMEKFN